VPPTMRENTTIAVALNYHSHIEEADQAKEKF
jgi:2-keto-4-pentenoate hydratase/2-oxohepta-3-ene-1,7-dioic acid hydratase in catechol pathway